MLHTQTWRVLLANIVDDPQKRTQLARALHVRPATLLYWTCSDLKPHPRQLRDLLQVLPEYNVSLSPLVADEVQRSIDASAVTLDDIPQVFRDRFHAGARNFSHPREMRIWSLSQLALQQMIAQLDPYHLGMVVKIVRCMPPSLVGKVRSLRESMGVGTPPWQHNVEHNMLFLGSNSLAGQAVSTRHIVTNDRLPPASEYERKHDFSGDYEASAVACPITRENRVAGCLYLASAYEAYFSPPRLLLIQRYTELVASIFEADDFHELHTITLWDMPAQEYQQSYLATLRPRIVKLLQEQQLSFIAAEELAWQLIEQELLQVLW